MKILVLGSAGMLGHVVTTHLRNNKMLEVFDVSSQRKFTEKSEVVDVRNQKRMSELINAIKPDCFINCVGILVNASSVSPSNAIYINSFFPHWLADEAKKIEAKVIHISTDCVFNGLKGAYSEADLTDAFDVYGRSKALGELIGDNLLTLRTSIIGPELKPEGVGLFNWFVRQKGIVNGFTNVGWGGVTTLQLAQEIEKHISSGVTGLLNVTNGTRISKFDLLMSIKAVFGLKHVDVVGFDSKVSDKSLISLRNDVTQEIPLYEDMLFDLRKFMILNRHLYSIYEDFMDLKN